MTNVVLANPNDSEIAVEQFAVYENLGLAMLAAYLRNAGHTVHIVDAYADDFGNDELAARIAQLSPELVGLTCNYQSLPDAKRVADEIRQLCPSVHITAGGEHATYSAQAMLEDGDTFDSIVRGEGEETFNELANAIGRGDSFTGIPGLWTRDGALLIKNCDRLAIANLDDMPFAARDTLKNYSMSQQSRSILIGMLASRGCYSKCSFCNANEFLRLGGGRIVRRRSPANVVAELDEIFQTYGREIIASGGDLAIYFYDATFVTRDEPSKRWARQIAYGLIEKGIWMPFICYIRADSFNDDDDDLVNLLKQAGLIRVFVGFESAGESTLSGLKKGTTPEDNWSTIRLLKRHSLLGSTNGFIMFSPYTTMDDVRESVDFLVEAQQATLWNLTQKIQLFPGARIIADVKRDGLLLDGVGVDGLPRYSFQIEDVGRLASLVGWNNHPVAKRENVLVRYVRNTISQIQVLSDRTADPSDFKLDTRCFGIVEEILDEITRANAEFFRELVSFVEQSLTTAEFRGTTGRHMMWLSSKLDELEVVMLEVLNVSGDQTNGDQFEFTGRQPGSETCV